MRVFLEPSGKVNSESDFNENSIEKTRKSYNRNYSRTLSEKSKKFGS
jgi:hypothetical protein